MSSSKVGYCHLLKISATKEKMTTFHTFGIKVAKWSLIYKGI